MSLNFLLKGLLIGFSIAAPVGPIGVLCIRRSLAQGWRYGLATGLGAAAADAAYGCIAAFGLTAVSGFLIGHRPFLGLAGGLFLCFLGARTFLGSPSTHAAPVPRDGLFSASLSTFLLTLANPATILSFAAVFAGMGLGRSPDYPAAGLLVAGVFTGSALWWVLLSTGLALLRARTGFRSLQLINRASGCVLFAFGICSLSAACY